MKIGAAIIACDRREYTKQCVEFLETNSRDLDLFVIVNDGRHISLLDEMDNGQEPDITILDNNPPYQSVGVTKNRALDHLFLKEGCTDVFLIENDILVKSPDVFKKYIEASKETGIQHLNFGYHGPANRDPSAYSQVRPRCIIEYPNNVKIALNAHSVGAFSYYTRDFIYKVGLHDTFFKNAWEHVELCQRAVEKGLLPAFWWFPDLAESELLLEEIPNSIQNSSITHTEQWTDNMRRGAEHFKRLHGYIPIQIPDTPFDEVKKNLSKIYHKK